MKGRASEAVCTTMQASTQHERGRTDGRLHSCEIRIARDQGLPAVVSGRQHVRLPLAETLLRCARLAICPGHPGKDQKPCNWWDWAGRKSGAGKVIRVGLGR
eukprot:1160876-Pelagomonas_calceolata.AAC.3